jgi:Family of unknown function (DUF5677)
MPDESEGEAFLRESIETGTSAVRTVLECATALRIDPHDSAQLHAVAFHGTITELFGACLVLAEDRDHAIGIPILLRSMQEALVDLDNVVNDAGYVENIEAANLKQILKLLNSAKTNPMLAGLLEQHPKDADELWAELHARNARGKRSLKIYDRFVMAGMQNEYDGLYALLCLDAHSNSAALADRHIDELPDGTPQVSIFRRGDAATIGRRLNLGLNMLARSAEMIHAVFGARRPKH